MLCMCIHVVDCMLLPLLVCAVRKSRSLVNIRDTGNGWGVHTCKIFGEYNIIGYVYLLNRVWGLLHMCVLCNWE